VLPAITTLPPLSGYHLRSSHKSLTPFFCKLLPLPMNEFTYARLMSSPPSPHLTLIATTVSQSLLAQIPLGRLFLKPYLFPAFIRRLALICITMSIDTVVSLLIWILVRRHTECSSGSLVSGRHTSYLSTIFSFTPSMMYASSNLKLVRPKRTYIVIAFMKDDAPNCISTRFAPTLR
jgi:hypothetical protein